MATKPRSKLQTLKPRIQTIGSQLKMITPGRIGTVERKRGSAGVKDRNRIRERDCGICQLCKENGLGTPATTVDHKTPLWAGGSDEDDNKWLLCDECHDEKTAQEAAQRAAGGL